MNLDKSRHNAFSQVVLGILVIGLGVLFLLDNLDIINFRHALPFWPLVLVIVGVVKMLDTRSRNGYVIGAAFVAAGVLMTLHRLGFFYISWRSLWPLGLIALGGTVLYQAVVHGGVRRTPSSTVHGLPDGAGGATDEYVDITAILGGVQRRVSATLRGGEITAVMGGCELDMRGATIVGDAVLHVFAVFGGITIKCPPDWAVVLEGTPIMGGFDEKTIAPQDNSKRLIVRGYAIMGGVEIRN